VQILRDKNGLIYEWKSFPDFITESGYLVFSASCAHENVEKVVGIVRREFERLHKGKISKEEFENAKSFASGSLLSTIEKGEDYIDWYGLQELLCPDKVLSVEEKVKQYENISFEEIKNTASKYLGEENIFIGVIGRGNESNLKKLL
jgi:predicted Zn-dependent peptidase